LLVGTIDFTVTAHEAFRRFLEGRFLQQALTPTLVFGLPARLPCVESNGRAGLVEILLALLRCSAGKGVAPIEQPTAIIKNENERKQNTRSVMLYFFST